MTAESLPGLSPEKKTRTPPPGRRGGFGRQKGTPNKTTIEVKEALKRFLYDPDYQDNVMDRIKAGRADHLEKYFWEVLIGRPKIIVEVGMPTRTRSIAEQLRMLTKVERLAFATLTRKALGAARIIDAKAERVGSEVPSE
jgi:hypothetical protein